MKTNETHGVKISLQNMATPVKCLLKIKLNCLSYHKKYLKVHVNLIFECSLQGLNDIFVV